MAKSVVDVAPSDVISGGVVRRDITLFSGGMFPRLLRRMGLRDAAFERARTLAVVALPLVLWVPLFVLSAIGGNLLNRSLGTPFLPDLGAHIRLLLVLPLLLVAGHVAENRIGPTIEQFVSRFIIPDEAQKKFQSILASAYRLGDSIIADVVTIAIIVVSESAIARQTSAGLQTSTWYATLSKSGTAFTPAGIWYVYACLPVFQFVLLRWYYRLFIWARFLIQVSRLNLRLLPTHPDQVGGLGFVISSMQALGVFAMAHGALLAAWLSNRVLIRGMSIVGFKSEIAVVVVFVLLITLAPLLAFTRPLIAAKRRGILEYGALASRYVYDFDRKWVHASAPGGEPLVGSADVQSLADMGGGYELVQNMRSVPIGGRLLITFVIATLIPVAPYLLTVMPLEELLKKLAGILF